MTKRIHINVTVDPDLKRAMDAQSQLAHTNWSRVFRWAVRVYLEDSDKLDKFGSLSAEVAMLRLAIEGIDIPDRHR